MTKTTSFAPLSLIVLAAAALGCSPLSPSTAKQLNLDPGRGVIGDSAVGARAATQATSGTTGPANSATAIKLRTVVKADQAFNALMSAVQDDYRYVLSDKENVHDFEAFLEKRSVMLELDLNGPIPADVVAYVEVIRPRADCAEGLVAEACGGELEEFQLMLDRKNTRHFLLSVSPQVDQLLWKRVKTNLVGIALSFSSRPRAGAASSRLLDPAAGLTGVTAPSGAAGATGASGSSGLTGITGR